MTQKFIRRSKAEASRTSCPKRWRVRGGVEWDLLPEHPPMMEQEGMEWDL